MTSIHSRCQQWLPWTKTKHFYGSFMLFAKNLKALLLVTGLFKFLDYLDERCENNVYLVFEISLHCSDFNILVLVQTQETLPSLIYFKATIVEITTTHDFIAGKLKVTGLTIFVYSKYPSLVPQIFNINI